MKDGDMVIMKIDESETIGLEDTSRPVIEGVTPSDLAKHLNANEPRYSYYKHSYAAPEGQQSAVIFIYTCPTPTKVRQRMIYASSRRSAEVLAEQEARVPLAKKIEATDPNEITAEMIEAEFAPKQEQKSGFAKPKRPGRR